jgi:hypothetical protein
MNGCIIMSTGREFIREPMCERREQIIRHMVAGTSTPDWFRSMFNEYSMEELERAVKEKKCIDNFLEGDTYYSIYPGCSKSRDDLNKKTNHCAIL